MNEDFMRQFQKMPDSILLEKIHARLEKRERAQIIKRYAFLSVLALVSMFGVLVTFSSTVRAEVLQTIEEIAGLQFEVTTDYPGNSEEEIVVPSEHLSLEEAQGRFESPVALPTYMPPGYERQTDVEFLILGDIPTLTIRWNSNKKHTGSIDLHIDHCSANIANCGLIVGEGALEEIMLNGKPAVVVRGAWNYDTQQYDLSVVTAVQWRYDENTVYTLQCWNPDISLDELVKMAESIP